VSSHRKLRVRGHVSRKPESACHQAIQSSMIDPDDSHQGTIMDKPCRARRRKP